MLLSKTVNFYKRVKPVVDISVRKLCVRPYGLDSKTGRYSHPKGCPNWDNKIGCPPYISYINKVIHLDQPVYVIYNRFNFGEHCDRMREKHPEWSPRRVACCLYWQGKARKQLKEKKKEFKSLFPGFLILDTPEGMGVNVTATMKKIGIELEWPPEQYSYQVAIAGKRNRNVCHRP